MKKCATFDEFLLFLEYREKGNIGSKERKVKERGDREEETKREGKKREKGMKGEKEKRKNKEDVE